jgi:hypothetical protein
MVGLMQLGAIDDRTSEIGARRREVANSRATPARRKMKIRKSPLRTPAAAPIP